MQDGSVRDSTIQVISQRILVLLDYLLHKLPYWSTGNYEKRVKLARSTSGQPANHDQYLFGAAQRGNPSEG